MDKSNFDPEEKGMRDNKMKGDSIKNVVVTSSSTGKIKKKPESIEKKMVIVSSSGGKQSNKQQSADQKIVISKTSIGKRNNSASLNDAQGSHHKSTGTSGKKQNSRINQKQRILFSVGNMWNKLNVLIQKMVIALSSFKGKIGSKSGSIHEKSGAKNRKMVGGETITVKRSKKPYMVGLGAFGGCAVIVIALFTFLKEPNSGSNQKLKFEEGEVYYTSTVTKEEAEKLGRYLVRTDFFAGASRSIQYNKNGNINEFKMNIKEGEVIKPIDPNVCRQITRDLSQEVFNGAHVNVHLTDGKFNTIWVTKQAPSFGKKLVFNGGDLYYTASITPAVATRLGNYLVKSNFYDGSHKSTLLNKADDIYEFKMVVKEGAENDPNTLAAGTQMIKDLSSELFHGSRVNVYLTDNEFKALKVLVQKDYSDDKKDNGAVAAETLIEKDILNETESKENITDSVNINELVIRLRSYDPVERGLAAVSLGEAGSQSAPVVDALIRLLVDYTKLTKKGPYEGKWPVFVDEDVDLDEYPTYVDKVAAWSLAKIGGFAVQSLVSALNHEDWRIQRYAAKILGKIGSPRAEEPLILTLNDENWLVQEEAVNALKKITGKDDTTWIRGKTNIDLLIGALEEENVRVKWDVIKALGQVKDPRALYPLVDILKQKYGDPLLQELVLKTIGELHDNRAVTPLIALLDDKDVSTSIQELAVKILGDLKDSRAVGAIIVAMEIPHFKDEAAVALRNLTGEDFGEDVNKWRAWDQQLKGIDTEKHNVAQGIQSDLTSEDSTSFTEIEKIHPDFLEVISNQMFTDYVNNLQPQNYEEAKRIVESGSMDEVSKLITVYKEQVDTQKSHRLMIKKMIENYIDPRQKHRVGRVVQDWAKESGEFSSIIKWNIKKIYEDSFLVDYIAHGDSFEQKFLYEVDMSTNAINRVWENDSDKLPNEIAIMMVKESYIMDSQNKTKTKHVIMSKKDEIKGEYKLIGWRSKRLEGQTFLVSYTYEKEFKEHGWFFEVDIDTSIIRRKNAELAMNRITYE